MMRILSVFVVILLILVIPGQSNSAKIDVISESYSLDVVDFSPYHDVIANIQDSPTPIYGYYNPPTHPGPVHSGLAAFATGEVSEASITVQTYIHFNANGSAIAKILFNPAGATYLDFKGTVERYSDSRAYIGLIDWTLGQTLLPTIDDSKLYTVYYLTIPVDPSHLYLATSITRGFGGDIGSSAVHLTASTPEPATLLLLASGLVGLVGFRRKFSKWPKWGYQK